MLLWFCPTHLFTKLKPLHWSPTTTLMIKTQYYHKICPVFLVWIPSLLILCCPTSSLFPAATTLVMSLLWSLVPQSLCKFCSFYLLCASLSSSVQSLSRVQLCNPMDCSMPGLPGYHQHPEFTQTHVHRVSDAIQPSHPLLSPSFPALSLSQH